MHIFNYVESAISRDMLLDPMYTSGLIHSLTIIRFSQRERINNVRASLNLCALSWRLGQRNVQTFQFRILAFSGIFGFRKIFTKK